jgi:ABC-type lipoprotein release transport system permease subunit
MISLKLAFRNLIGAGLRTWLNAGVLSFSFVVIIFFYGMVDGWNLQSRRDTKEWEIGNGQLWHSQFDPFDIYTYQDAHAPISETIQELIDVQQLTPILLVQASVYPEGRMVNLLLKGIEPDQTLLKLPSDILNTKGDHVPVLLGKRMAKTLKLSEGDLLLVRWRDKNGTFDAVEVQVAAVFDCDVPTVDSGQMWFPLEQLQKMTGMINEATFFVADQSYSGESLETWLFRDVPYLMKDIDMIIQSKKGSMSVLSGLLLIIALLAIFDTQVLSIFRRQREIGTYIALGMTRWQVVKIFTIEGSAYSIFAAILATLYGTPLFFFMAKNGFVMPSASTDMGIAVSDVIYPEYSLGLIASTIVMVIVSATVVSFLPARKIAKLNPTDALKGKIQ